MFTGERDGRSTGIAEMSWTCEVCSTVNPAETATCSVCHAPMGVGSAAPLVPTVTPDRAPVAQAPVAQPSFNGPADPTATSTFPAADPGGGSGPPTRSRWAAIAVLAVLAVVVGVVAFVVVGGDDSGVETVDAPDRDRRPGSTDQTAVTGGDDPEVEDGDAAAPPVVDTRPTPSTTPTAPMVTSTTPPTPTTSGTTGLADGIANRWIAIRISAPTEAEVRDASARLEPGLTVVPTDGLPALRHPNWLAYAGPFDGPQDAVDYCVGQGITDFNACTIVFLDPTLTSVDGRPSFCGSTRAILRSDGGWDWWDSSTNAACA